MREPDINNDGLVPGLVYHGGPQRQRTGFRGLRARRFSMSYDSPDLSQCGFLQNEDCQEVFSRTLEQTYRSFAFPRRRASHIDPPFVAVCIEDVPAAPLVAFGTLYASPPVFSVIASLTIPPGRFRAVIVFAGQSAESAMAFDDIEWRITVDGIPFAPYESIRIQLWDMVPPTRLATPIHLRAGQEIRILARSLTPVNREVMARLAGWLYLVRSETGDNILSTIVD